MPRREEEEEDEAAEEARRNRESYSLELILGRTFRDPIKRFIQNVDAWDMKNEKKKKKS